jgi:gamma-glutamyltranspeptidase/glutathione hydrolase
MMIRRAFLLSLLGAILAGGALAQQPGQPEAATGRGQQQLVTTERTVVVTANPIASRVGFQVLQAGGSAVDAAIAIQLVLNLVEPQSSGLGGGAFMLYWDAATHHLTSYDAREIAPAGATPQLFLDAASRPLPFYDAVTGGIATGVPGVPRLLEFIHRRHGRLPWAQLFAPAIQLADEGFAVSPRLAGLLVDEQYLRNDPVSRAYFYHPDGTPLRAGETLRNPELVQTLRTLATNGADAFYSGPIAEAILAAVHREPRPGSLTAADFAAYRVIERDPVCGPYRIYQICGMGPPSSGGVTVLQILSLLAPFDLGTAPNADAYHLFTQANRLAFADRNQFLADPGFVPQPVAGLIDPRYLATRSALIDRARDSGTAAPGDPPGRSGGLLEPDLASERHATSHMIIIDRDGNIVTQTTTIEDQFGARRMAAGFLLNNQLTDFNFAPEAQGRPVANRVEPGKRPRSSMAPTIAFDQAGAPVIITGSPGGSLIIPYVAQALMALIDWHLDPQAAVSLPHVANRNGNTEVEQGTDSESLAAALIARGHTVRQVDMTSGLSAVVRRDSHWLSGADPRREGVALGE